MSSDPTALINVGQDDEREFFRRLMAACVSNSTWDLTGGRRGRYFWDIDAVPEPNELGVRLSEVVSTLRKKYPFDQVAFIERDSGPCGVIAYRSHVESLTKMPTSCVRPHKRLLLSSIKGAQLHKGGRVLLVNDVATDGDVILQAARKVWALGGFVSAALVVFDRLSGAKERLSQYDIPLHSLYDFASLNEVDEQNTFASEEAEGLVLQLV